MATWTAKVDGVDRVLAAHINALQTGKVDSDGTASPTFAGVTLDNGYLNLTPVTAPTAPAGTVAAGGSVDDGDHYYRVTFVTALGETTFGASSSAIATGGGNNTVNLTGIQVSPSPLVTARKIYRGTYGAPYYRYLAIINNNIVTTYQDTAANATLSAIGGQSKWDTTAGMINIGGVRAGYIGPSNVGLGFGVLAAITTGFDNSAFGWGSIAAATTGWNLTAVGVNALTGNTTGSQNTAIGVHALQDNTTGSTNTGIGVSALEKNLTGDNGVAIGFGALGISKTGNGNVAVGVYALGHNDGGAENVGVGLNALYATTSGSYNVAIGPSAGIALTTGRNNVAIGVESLYTQVGGWNNTAIGVNAFRSLPGTVNGGVAIGAFAGYYETAAAKLFIDNDLRASEADARIKALIYGQFAATTAAQYLWINGRFGVLLAEVLTAANNAGAAAAGVLVGQFYRTNADPSILCIRSA